MLIKVIGGEGKEYRYAFNLIVIGVVDGVVCYSFPVIIISLSGDDEEVYV